MPPNISHKNRTNPVSKLVKENLEMTENEKQKQDYLGYLNRINAKVKKYHKQNIDERNNN